MAHLDAIAGLEGRAARRAAPSRDPDFRRLLGEAAWARLPAAVQYRFATHAAPCLYPGSMEVRASWFGLLIAQLCRLIGTPLAPWTGRDVPVDVTVRAAAGGGMDWDRVYSFEGRAAVTVTSRKVLSPSGDLLEVVRGGLGMRLAVSEEGEALVFRSTGYILQLGPWTLPIPALLTPGAAWVEHRDLGGGAFRFSLRFIHPLAGETLFQSGVFHDPA